MAIKTFLTNNVYGTYSDPGTYAVNITDATATGTIVADVPEETTGESLGLAIARTTAFTANTGNVGWASAGSDGFTVEFWRSAFYGPAAGSTVEVISGFAAGQTGTITFGGNHGSNARPTKLTTSVDSGEYFCTTAPPATPVTVNFEADGSGNVTLTWTIATGGDTFFFVNGYRVSYDPDTAVSLISVTDPIQDGDTITAVLSAPDLTIETIRVTSGGYTDTFAASTSDGGTTYTATYAPTTLPFTGSCTVAVWDSTTQVASLASTLTSAYQAVTAASAVDNDPLYLAYYLDSGSKPLADGSQIEWNEAGTTIDADSLVHQTSPADIPFRVWDVSDGSRTAWLSADYYVATDGTCSQSAIYILF